MTVFHLTALPYLCRHTSRKAQISKSYIDDAILGYLIFTLEDA